MKKCIAWTIITLIFVGCQHKNGKTSALTDFIPQKAHIVIKINHLSRLKSELKNNTFLNNLSTAEAYRTLLEKLDPLEYLQTESPSLLVFGIPERASTEFLFVTPYHDNLLDLENQENKKIESQTHKDGGITKYTLDDTVFFSSLKEDFLLISSTEEMLTHSLNNSEQTAIDPTLKSLLAASDPERAASVFMKTQGHNALGNTILNVGSELHPVNFSQWISLDLDTRQDHLALSGMSIPSDTSKSVLHLFKDIAPLSSKTPFFAPKASDALLAYSFGDYSRFSKNRRDLLGNSVASDSIFRTVEEVGHIYRDRNKAVLLHTYGAEDIVDFLKSLQNRTLNYQGNEIGVLNKNDFLNAFFHPIIQNFGANFYTTIENTLIFSSELNFLEFILRNYKGGNTFNSTSAYESIETSLADEANVLFIARAKGMEEVLKADLSDQFLSDFKAASPSSFVFGAQAVTDSDFYHLSVMAQQIRSSTKNSKASQLFSVKLETNMATTPQFVINHSTNKKEIVVQDENNNLYLIATDGKVLWKKQLNGRIQGRISQVDLYKNGRLQLAFTTHEQFIILDRNGKEVQPFVKDYAGGNLNPLAVFDYDNTKNYRFVVTQGTKVFMYNPKGEIVKGFTYTEAENQILTAPKHIRIGQKDYLVFKLENGRLKILSRTGKERVKVTERIDFSENDIFLYRNKFITTNKEGVLFSIDQKGNLAKSRLKLIADHGIDATAKTLAVMNDNVLTIKGKKVTLDLGVYTAPQIFYLYDKIYVSVTDIQSEQVYLFDSQTKPIASFPVFGASEIDLNDMDNDGKLEIVTKEDESAILVYGLN